MKGLDDQRAFGLHELFEEKQDVELGLGRNVVLDDVFDDENGLVHLLLFALEEIFEKEIAEVDELALRVRRQFLQKKVLQFFVNCIAEHYLLNRYLAWAFETSVQFKFLL